MPSNEALGEPAVSGNRTALREDIFATLMPGFSGLGMPEWVPGVYAAGVRSFCIYGENVQDAEQLRSLGAHLRSACPESLVAIDEEGGEVTRLHYFEGSPYPGAAVLGRIDDLEYTELIGERVGRDILAAGCNLALGPIADVNSNPLNPVIGTRSFAADPELAARHVAAWIRGLQRTGAIACAKHFPGHGDTAQDSHLALPAVDVPLKVLERRELPPFRSAVNAGVASVMTSHILLPRIDPAGPATFSRPVLQGLLRDELEFEGVIVSDALDMAGASGEIGIPEATVRALIAGCDLLCLGTQSSVDLLREIQETVLAAIDSGRLDEDRVREAAARVRALAERSRIEASSIRVLESSPDPSIGELDRIVSSFDGLRRSRDWLARFPNASVMRVDSDANMAVGEVPWGPFAAEAAPFSGLAASVREAAGFSVRARLGTEDPEEEARHAEGVLVIGRDLHRSPATRARIDAMRAAGTPVLAIEMGWPGEGSATAYADLGCYGSSRLVGAALLHLIEGDSA